MVTYAGSLPLGLGLTERKGAHTTAKATAAAISYASRESGDNAPQLVIETQ
jgi:hypothetical protein